MRFEYRKGTTIFSKEYLDAIDFENADIPHLADLPAVEQFHLACVLIEIIAQRHAVPPFPDFNNLLSLGNS